MKPAQLADTMGAVENINRREWIRNVAALGSLAGVSSLLGACGSSTRRVASLVGKPIPENPHPAPTYTPSAPVHVAETSVAPATSYFGLPSGVIPRTQWAASGPEVRLADPMGHIDRITVHHDGMPPHTVRGASACANYIEAIRRGHRRNGWADIGYHFIVDPDGRVWEGRPLTLQGAHVKDHNYHNMGVLVLGNFEIQYPTDAAKASLMKFLTMQMRRYNVQLSEVWTHQELAPTACPGRHLQTVMESTRSRGGVLARA